MYEAGILEGMTQVEALRLAMQKCLLKSSRRETYWSMVFTRSKTLTPVQISSTPLTYGEGDVEGVDSVRIDQVQNGKVVKVGLYPLRNIYTRK